LKVDQLTDFLAYKREFDRQQNVLYSYDNPNPGFIHEIDGIYAMFLHHFSGGGGSDSWWVIQGEWYFFGETTSSGVRGEVIDFRPDDLSVEIKTLVPSKTVTWGTVSAEHRMIIHANDISRFSRILKIDPPRVVGSYDSNLIQLSYQGVDVGATSKTGDGHSAICIRVMPPELEGPIFGSSRLRRNRSVFSYFWLVEGTHYRLILKDGSTIKGQLKSIYSDGQLLIQPSSHVPDADQKIVDIKCLESFEINDKPSSRLP
jgi:hypothetical protein